MNIQQDDAALRDILDEAVEIPPRSRPTFLDAACGQNRTLRKRLDELLDSLDHAIDFLVDPTVDAPPSAHGRNIHGNTHQLGTQIDKYELLDVIGEGGMGTVYRAHQKWPVRRDVALKVIKLGMDTGKVIIRFDTERQALAMMDHPSIAKVLDAGATSSGRPFFVMELVRGMPITEYCDQNLLNIERRLDLFMQVCNAVQHAHQKGIIHRDLKPSNILVTMLDGLPVPKIIDFGIAKATSQTMIGQDPTEATEVWQMMGTPLYMSPEQVEHSGINVDTRSDVYALGVVLYELLTGTTPFDRSRLKSVTREELCRIIREEVPPRPSTRLLPLAPDLAATVASQRQSDPKRLVQTIRGDLDWIVMRCLEKDRALRYESTSTLALDIRRYIGHEPIEASPPSTRYRMRKFVQRHRGAIVAAGGFAAVLVAATIISVWQAYRATWAQGVAINQKREADHMRMVAEHEELETHISLRRADSVKQLLQTILASANLNSGASKDVNLLDKISGDLDKRFTGQPQAQLEAGEILAEAYEDLGNDESSRNQYQRAYDISSRLPDGVKSEQTLRIAAELAYHQNSIFADHTYQAARQTLGDSSPITQRAIRSLVHQLSPGGGFGRHSQQNIDRAEQLSRDLVAQVERRPVEATTPETYQYMNQLAVLLNSTQNYVEAEQVARRALKRADADGHVGGITRGALGFSLTESLAARGKLSDAVQVASATYADERVAIGDFHPNTEKMLKRYAEILAALHRSAEGDKLIADSLVRAKELYPKGGSAVVGRSAILAQYRVDNGMVASGRIQMTEAAKLQLQFRDGKRTDGKYRLLVREALLLGLGAKAQLPDGSVLAQVFCALNEIWCDHPEEAPDLESLEPSGVRFTLLPLGQANNRDSITATLADTPPPSSPRPGLYLMTVEISPRGSAKRAYSKWVLISDWNISIFAAQQIDLTGLDTSSASSDQKVWEAKVPAVTLLNSFADAFVTPAPLETARATTTVELPAGRYRFAAASVDGVLLFVDGRRVINSWSAHRARRDVWGLELDSGPHVLTVEHFRKGRGNFLWVRIEPLSLAAPNSPRFPAPSDTPTLSHAIDELEGPAGADALSSLAGLLAHDGQFPAAAERYKAAIAMDQSEPFWRRQRALLGLLMNDRSVFREECNLMLSAGSVSNDRNAAAHTAIIALLDPATAQNSKPVQTLLGAADPEKSRPSERAICQFAQGVSEYRAGGYDHGISILAEASAGRLTDEARVAANLFKAMAMYRQGNPSAALIEFRRLEQAFDGLPNVHQTQIDPPQLQDRLICQVALRQAQALIDPRTPATRPTTRPAVVKRSAPAAASEPAQLGVE